MLSQLRLCSRLEAILHLISLELTELICAYAGQWHCCVTVAYHSLHQASVCERERERERESVTLLRHRKRYEGEISHLVVRRMCCRGITEWEQIPNYFTVCLCRKWARLMELQKEVTLKTCSCLSCCPERPCSRCSYPQSPDVWRDTGKLCKWPNLTGNCSRSDSSVVVCQNEIVVDVPLLCVCWNVPSIGMRWVLLFLSLYRRGSRCLKIGHGRFIIDPSQFTVDDSPLHIHDNEQLLLTGC